MHAVPDFTCQSMDECMDARYKPIYRLGALCIRRTLEVNGIRLTGQHFASSVDDDKGEANDWRLMWLQKNNHSGQDAEDFGGAWSCYTKVGFPIEYYKRIRTGVDLNSVSALHNDSDEAHDGACLNGASSSLVRPWASQFINHFPGSEALDNKATMAACIRSAAGADPEAFSSGYFPHYVFNDRTALPCVMSGAKSATEC